MYYFVIHYIFSDGEMLSCNNISNFPIRKVVAREKLAAQRLGLGLDV